MNNILNTFVARFAIVLLTSILCVWIAFLRNWLWLPIAVVVWATAVWRFYRLYTYNTRKVAFLLDAIENNDPAVHFYEQVPDENASQVNIMLNRIARILQNIKLETIQREKYYELILDFVETGIVVLNEKGAVHQKNRKALELLGIEVFTHTKQLSRISEELQHTLEKARPGDKLQAAYHNEHGTVNLSLRVSGITIRDKKLRIIALNDINRELDEKEIDTWIRLTRVLTHEIMNSLTPVTSLSETLLTLPDAQGGEIRQGLETIRTTGNGLINFVTSYRRLTHLPTPRPAFFHVRPFLERMIQLARHQYPCAHIRFTLNVEEGSEEEEKQIMLADESLMAQVLTNLLKNAIQAIGSEKGEIRIHAYCDERESIHIEVANNGPRIPDEVAEQIFVPFFTTKDEGSGIGLSLSKQIMRLNGGTLTLLPYSPKNPWTVFEVTIN